MTLHLRPEGADDHHAVRAVLVAAFGSAREADLVDRIRASPHYRPELSLVAQVDDRVVGQVMLDGTWLDSRVGRREVLMLTPLAVDPPWQGRGIGRALVHRALSLADDAGEPLVVLEGAPGYYGRLGFAHAASHGIDLPLPSWAPRGGAGTAADPLPSRRCDVAWSDRVPTGVRRPGRRRDRGLSRSGRAGAAYPCWARARASAARTSPRWLKACGKLPTWRRRTGSYSSA
ncbi:GNAT family N-acetyltransferase [Ornithinicoccus halotolerans]|uniref:GNAT family N-acetyltransferase n=1 Tax=Ornithinicoccus halotolerans TaxID=1748220 RepID=UPI001E473955|nr:N-acetyltransferase [Ornithinicoccus halotolerans]